MKFILFLLLLVLTGGFTFSGAFADHSEVTIEAAQGSGAPGCEETAEGCYIPGTATVDVGGVVIFSNTDSAAHTFTSGDPTIPEISAMLFDSGLTMAGSTFEWSPTEVGEVPYYCAVHPWMQGLIIVQEEEAESEEYVSLPLSISFDKLNYQTTETAMLSITGTSSSIVSLLIIGPSDTPVLDAISITLQSDGTENYNLDLSGFVTGVHTAVISKGSSQSTEIFTIGLQTGSTDIEINTTKIEYQPGDSILVLGDSGANLLLTISLIDPNGNTIKVKETFSDKNGKISDSSFRIPSDAMSGIWEIKAQSGSNFDITELQVGSITDDGLTVTVEPGPDIPGYGETISIHVFGAMQTVTIEIIAEDGETIEELSFPASPGSKIEI